MSEKGAVVMPLAEQLRDYINAAFTGLWVQTQEPDEAEREILQHARGQQWKAAVWDVAQGMRLVGREASSGDAGGDTQSYADWHGGCQGSYSAVRRRKSLCIPLLELNVGCKFFQTCF